MKGAESVSEGIELSPRDQGSGKVPRAGYNIVVATGPQIFLSFNHILKWLKLVVSYSTIT